MPAQAQAAGFQLNFGGLGPYTVPIRQEGGGAYNESVQKAGKVWQTSGGVLFINLPKFREMVRNATVDVDTRFSDEEQWSDNLLAGQSGYLFALSPKYNFRPTMARQIKQLDIKSPSVQLTQEEEEVINSVKNMKNTNTSFECCCSGDFPVIVHWDTQKKPWEKKTDEDEFDADIYWKQERIEANAEMEKIGPIVSQNQNFEDFLNQLYPALQQPLPEYIGIFASNDLDTITEED